VANVSCMRDFQEMCIVKTTLYNNYLQR
jgi:hypothetical protein